MKITSLLQKKNLRVESSVLIEIIGSALTDRLQQLLIRALGYTEWMKLWNTLEAVIKMHIVTSDARDGCCGLGHRQLYPVVRAVVVRAGCQHQSWELELCVSTRAGGLEPESRAKPNVRA